MKSEVGQTPNEYGFTFVSLGAVYQPILLATPHRNAELQPRDSRTLATPGPKLFVLPLLLE